MPTEHGWAELASREQRGEKAGLAGGPGRSEKRVCQTAQPKTAARKLAGRGCRRLMCGDQALGTSRDKSRDKGDNLCQF